MITIDKKERSKDLDFGYAGISKYSDYFGESEVLFNPLNTFLIEKVEEENQICCVYLRYGALA